MNVSGHTIKIIIFVGIYIYIYICSLKDYNKLQDSPQDYHQFHYRCLRLSWTLIAQEQKKKMLNERNTRPHSILQPFLRLVKLLPSFILGTIAVMDRMEPDSEQCK